MDKIQISIKNGVVFEGKKQMVSTPDSIVAAALYLMDKGVLRENSSKLKIWNLYNKKGSMVYQLFFYPVD